MTTYNYMKKYKERRSKLKLCSECSNKAEGKILCKFCLLRRDVQILKKDMRKIVFRVLELESSRLTQLTGKN